MIKSQVLTGGRMKAGGVKFADTPEEAAAHAEEILKLEINGHMPRGVLVDPKAQLKQEYYAGVVWDGIRKQPVMLFSDMGGIDIEEVDEQHPDHVGRGAPLEPASRRPTSAPRRSIAQTGVTGRQLTRTTPILARLARLFSEYDMTLAEINPLGELEDGSFVALDAHMEMENEARPRQKALLKELGVGDEETREAREATHFEIARRAGRRDGPPRRGRQRDRVRRQPRPRDRRRRRLASRCSTRSASTAASPPTTARSAATRRSRRRPASPSSCSPSPASTRSP